MLNESTADCFTIDQAGSCGRRVGFLGRSVAESDVEAHGFDGGLEVGTLVGGESSARLPQVVGGGTVGSPWTRRGVGLDLREGDSVVGPIAGVTCAAGVTFGTSFQRTNAGFDGPIVPWRIGGREQGKHLRLGQEVLREGGAKGRTVIGFQNQRRTMLSEEPMKCLDGVFGVGVWHGQPEQLLTAGQIAHRQEVRSGAVDRLRRLAEVHGPDRAGSLPVQDAGRMLVAALPDAAVAPQEIFEFGTRHEGEAISQGRQSGSGAEFVEDRQDGAAFVAWGAQRRPAQSNGRRRHAVEVGTPEAERACREPQQLGDLGIGLAVAVEVVGKFDEVAAQGVFPLPLGKLEGTAAAVLARGLARGVTEGVQAFHVFFFFPRVRGRRRVFFFGSAGGAGTTRGKVRAISARA